MRYVLEYQGGEMVGNTYIPGHDGNHEQIFEAKSDEEAVKKARGIRLKLIAEHSHSIKVGYFRFIRREVIAEDDELMKSTEKV